MGKKTQEDEDWLGFDKLAKMLGEFVDDNSPKPEVPIKPVAEKPIESEKSPKDPGGPTPTE